MIDVLHLTKRYGRLKAVDDVSFDIRPGEAVALWGANGAGKTTVLRCLLNLIPFEGQVIVDGHDVRRNAKIVRQKVGFVPQSLTFHDDLRVDETIGFYASLKKVDVLTAAPPLLERLALGPHLEKAVGDLSGGLKQRLALLLALLADPTVLLLDEPTASLDALAREDFLSLLVDLRRADKTIVFSTHRLEEMSALAERVLYMGEGRLAADCSPLDLRRQMGWTAQLHLFLPQESIDPALQLLDRHGLEGRRNGRGIFVAIPAGEKGALFRLLHEAGISVTDFSLD